LIFLLPMRPRQEITEMFSTFLYLKEGTFSQWLTDARLLKSIQKCVESTAVIEHSENFWVLYWHNKWRNNSSSLPGMHLSAYLQESCYWAAYKTITRFSNTRDELADYFQMANAEINKILADFNPEKGSPLKNYGNIALFTRIKDILRQRKEADICTKWGLLRKVSKKQVLEALQNAGLTPTSIAQYRLAWTCFKEVYVQNQPGGIHQLPEPDRHIWEAVSHLYNSDRHSQLTLPGAECNPQLMEQWLSIIANNIRKYLYPVVGSLNLTKPGENSSQELDLPDPASESLIAQIIAQDDEVSRQEQVTQMNSVLLKAIAQLDTQSQEIFNLYYQQELTQHKIIQQLQISQSTVSRRLIKARESLLAALIRWSQETLNISVTSNLIKDMSIALEEWLKIKYSESGLI
jgi:RNA polymerase sigma factor (sigma-70 family)